MRFGPPSRLAKPGKLHAWWLVPPPVAWRDDRSYSTWSAEPGGRASSKCGGSTPSHMSDPSHVLSHGSPATRHLGHLRARKWTKFSLKQQDTMARGEGCGCQVLALFLLSPAEGDVCKGSAQALGRELQLGKKGMDPHATRQCPVPLKSREASQMGSQPKHAQDNPSAAKALACATSSLPATSSQVQTRLNLERSP